MLECRELNITVTFGLIPKVGESVAKGCVYPSVEQSMLVRMIFLEVTRDHISFGSQNWMKISATAIDGADAFGRFDNCVIELEYWGIVDRNGEFRTVVFA